ncbi:hypothetical protein RC62_1525 [Flavobacterium aquidurense]|uniref:Uncharacterized protein n=1 Tax=Flavobacterium aquidurense TaxID=362413 RepID=A0A0Q0W0A4_9FLAO|nr:hypothetical protein RC62_1525 [Flavobacterium aquidurense]
MTIKVLWVRYTNLRNQLISKLKLSFLFHFKITNKKELFAS